MKDLNQVTIIGRLTRDGEMKYSQGGMALLNFAIACNRSVKDPMSGEYKDEASFFDCVAFGKSAESVAQYMMTGKQIGITGELVQDRWEKDGQKHSRVKINVNSIQLLASPNAREVSTGSPGPFPAATRTVSPQVKREAQVMASGRGDEFMDEIPFK